MKTHDEPNNINFYRKAITLQRIGNRAVRKAQEENRRLGIPNAYSRNGIIYYEKVSKQGK